MISFCTMSINSKFETRTFVEALCHHNPSLNFEICIAHDNRVNDGSKEYLAQLQAEYPCVKIIENTKKDSELYISRLIDYYDALNIFSQDFRDKLCSNFEAYQENSLCDSTKSYLWLALGYLYNKAASISSGDILVFAPSDYVWALNIALLESYVIAHREDGIFFGKFDGLLEDISNEPLECLSQVLQGPRPSGKILRQHICYPSRLNEHYLLDFDNHACYSLGDSDYQAKVKSMYERNIGDTTRVGAMHHGTHIMTRKTFEIIGGFTEEFYGRAWPDDKMNAQAMKLFWKNSSTLPKDFVFNWIGMSTWGQGFGGRHPGTLSQAELMKIDPWIQKHPVQGRDYSQTYLDHRYRDQIYVRNINASLDKEFAKCGVRGREAPVVRLT